MLFFSSLAFTLLLNETFIQRSKLSVLSRENYWKGNCAFKRLKTILGILLETSCLREMVTEINKSPLIDTFILIKFIKLLITLDKSHS